MCSDTVDNDCNGFADCNDTAACHCSCVPGSTQSCYDGPAGTNHVGICRPGTQTCGSSGTWGPCLNEVLPAPERAGTFQCFETVDDDCNGLVDCQDPGCGCQCQPGMTASCYDGPPGTAGVGICHAGIKTCGTGTWGPCVGEVVPALEMCADNVDNDCNGLTDCHDLDCPACCTPSDQDIPLLPRPADVLFVLDRSDSMGSKDILTKAGSISRWDALKQAVDQVLPQIDAAIDIGVLLFNDGTTKFQECLVPAAPQIAITPHAASAVSSLLQMQSPGGNTPTQEALVSAAKYLQRTASTHPRYLVLITDGVPNCTGSVPGVVNELSSIRTNEHVTTLVIGIPGNNTEAFVSLNKFADAGGAPRTGSRHFYAVTDLTSFVGALQAVVATTTSCTYTLSPPPPNPANVIIKLDGAPLAADPKNGWSYVGPSSIRFNGSSCTRITGGVVSSIAIREGC
jgi:hypothetical protein